LFSPQSTEKRSKVKYGSKESAAYTAFRFASVYAQQESIFEEICDREPNFEPSRVLDLGSGPGQSLWAVQSIWGTKLDESPYDNDCQEVDRTDHKLRFTCIEPAKSMQDIAMRIYEPGFFPNTSITWQSSIRDAFHSSYYHGYDLAIASHILGELKDRRAQESAVRLCWEALKPGGFLIILEEGDNAGFMVTNDMRNFVRNGKRSSMRDATIFAPCKHKQKCPLTRPNLFSSSETNEDLKVRTNSICTFPVRVERPGSPEFTHSYFSYLVLRKSAEDWDGANNTSDESVGRVIGTPRKRKGHVLFNICHENGNFESSIVSKKDNKKRPGIYKCTRKARWGDLWPPPTGIPIPSSADEEDADNADVIII
jgi:ribosomal protein RSM22 (predicted rRNA methylase)